MPFKGPLPSAQLESLARHIAREIPLELERRKHLLFEEWLDALQGFHLTRFKTQTDVEGAKWPPLAPLTIKIRKADGRRSSKAGGRKLLASLRQGGTGNVAEILDMGVRYGSDLKAGRGHLVIITFQSEFTVPKSARGLKAERVRRWMGWKVGIHAPAPGSVLLHKARPVIGISRQQLESLANFHLIWVDRVLSDAWEKWRPAA